MGIFARHRSAAEQPANGWYPLSGHVWERATEDMTQWFADWEGMGGCEGGRVFGTDFARDDAPGWLTVYVYPAPGPVWGTCVLRFAYEYRVETGGGVWTAIGYEDDPDEDWESAYLPAAQETAQDVVRGLITRTAESELECFGWDARST
jgi:hypothetical protein